MARNSSSVPNASSNCVLIRSKWPSTLGVVSHPLMPPARFTGPVWIAVIPMAWNASQRSWSPIVPRKEWPALVMREIGYAANQTGAFSMAARGSGSAKGFCHMLP
jgi:hypothetical protein